jgi:basic membrane protein A
MDAMRGTWKPGSRVMGLGQHGVDFSLDEYNRRLITPEMEKRLDKARADIIAGRIAVPEYKAP